MVRSDPKLFFCKAFLPQSRFILNLTFHFLNNQLFWDAHFLNKTADMSWKRLSSSFAGNDEPVCRCWSPPWRPWRIRTGEPTFDLTLSVLRDSGSTPSSGKCFRRLPKNKLKCIVNNLKYVYSLKVIVKVSYSLRL